MSQTKTRRKGRKTSALVGDLTASDSVSDLMAGKAVVIARQ